MSRDLLMIGLMLGLPGFVHAIPVDGAPRTGVQLDERESAWAHFTESERLHCQNATRDSIDFVVLGEDNQFLLRWVAPPVFSCLEYTIERAWSGDYRISEQTRWEEIGKEPGLCNVASSITYTYLDRTAESLSEGSVQYRLRLRLLSGEEYSVYSDVITVALPEHMQILALYPFPAVQTISMTIALPTASAVSFEIHDMSGRMLHEGDRIEFPQGVHTLRADISSVPSGAYVLQLRSEGSTVYRALNITH